MFFDAEFLDYLKIGWDHIIDIKAYDHLLFIMVLCAVFTLREWRKILIIITAFTIGHSLTLALSALELIITDPVLVELLIPSTILLTALANIVSKKKATEGKTFETRLVLNYMIALSFGLIHGLGFAGSFRFLMGEENSILKQLFAFNSGLELGQITVVLIFMLVFWLLTVFAKIMHREWMLVISGAGAGISLIMIIDILNQ
jgi:hypothetical protein